MADIKYGKNASLRLASGLILRMTGWSITQSTEFQDITSFGDTYIKRVPNYQGWTASATGIIDLDSDGQQQLWQYMKSQTKITTIRFYIDANTYYGPDTVTDSEAGVYISSITHNAENKNVQTFTIAFEGFGSIDSFGTGDLYSNWSSSSSSSSKS
jgi:hypothetical protein